MNSGIYQALLESKRNKADGEETWGLLLCAVSGDMPRMDIMNETDIESTTTRSSGIPGTYHKLFAEVRKASQDVIYISQTRTIHLLEASKKSRVFASVWSAGTPPSCIRLRWPPALPFLPVHTPASFRNSYTIAQQKQ